MAKVLAISSQVVMGSVGLSIAVPALQAEGHDVLAVPTVLLSNHPGLGAPKGGAIDIAPLLDGAGSIEAFAGVDAVFTGYFSKPEQVEKAAEVIRALKPGLVVVDPILGDSGRLYVTEAVAQAIKTHLVPLATVLTPNVFELSWLAGRAIGDEADAVAAARALERPEVIVTSVPAGEKLLTLRVTADAVQQAFTVKQEKVPHGTGDYLAGLYLSHRLKQDADKAFSATMARLETVIAASVGRRTLEWQINRQTRSSTIIGVDGCKGGWIAAIWNDEGLRTQFFKRFEDILATDAQIIAVDMPIGLRDGEARSAESAARKFIGKRSSSVFPVPSRSTVQKLVPFDSDAYDIAKSVNASTTSPSKMLSKQAFALIPKIQEIDACLDRDVQSRVFEVHPEVSFCAMNGNTPLAYAKTEEDGEAERLELLGRSDLPELTEALFEHRRNEVGRDDVIDALAAVWSARRIADSTARFFPEIEERDSKGLLMRIHA